MISYHDDKEINMQKMSHLNYLFLQKFFAVLEMKIWIFWSESNSWIYFYIVLNKNWKIYWSEQSFAGFGPEDRCSSQGLYMYLFTVKLAHAFTLNKQSPVLKGLLFFPCPVIENFIWIEPLLRGHMSYKTTFFLFCHRKFHMNWTSFKRSHVL
jgi:hypothetical protein